jgi:hypothetical protein
MMVVLAIALAVTGLLAAEQGSWLVLLDVTGLCTAVRGAGLEPARGRG